MFDTPPHFREAQNRPQHKAQGFPNLYEGHLKSSRFHPPGKAGENKVVVNFPGYLDLELAMDLKKDPSKF